MELKGAEHLSSCIQKQINELGRIWIIDITANENQSSSINTFIATLNKRIQKCFKILEDLGTDWKGILPPALYKKAVGQILNYFFNHFINTLLKFDHDNQPLNKHSKDNLNIFLQFGLWIFDEPELLEFVRFEKKITELIWIISSTLADLETKCCSIDRGGLDSIYNNLEVRKFIEILYPVIIKR